MTLVQAQPGTHPSQLARVEPGHNYLFILVRLVYYYSSRRTGMTDAYSTYEAKAKFSEVIRKVRAGQRVVIAYRGEEVAEIRPIEPREGKLAKALVRLEDRGILSRTRKPTGNLRPLARKPGALSRFLESRE